MMTIKFAHPWFLILLFSLIPLFLYGRRMGGRFRFSNISLLKGIKQQRNIPFHPRDFLLILRALALIFFIFALARPQQGKRFSEVSSEGVDIIMALDMSGSMQALDFFLEGDRVERATVVKNVVVDFIKKRPNDRMGLVVFGEEAYTQCPLTLDHGILIEFLKKVKIGMAGQATAIGSALGTAVKRLKDIKAKSKIVLLLTDGKSNAGELNPIDAAKLANTYGVKVYTIGVGTKGKAPFKVESFFGTHLQYADVEFDEDTLIEVARITNAKYFAANNTEELKKIYDEIDRLEKREVKMKEYTEYNELFHFFIIIGLLMLLTEVILAQTRLRKIP